MRKILFALVTIAPIFGACSSGAEPEADVTPAPSRDEAACSNQGAVVKGDGRREPGRLAGDLEDDGVRDDVFLAVDRDGEEGCRAFIVVEGEGTIRSAPIAVPEIPFELGFPRLISMPLIDDRPGAEILVGVASGASTQFAAIYTVDDDGRLVQAVREGAASPQENLLAFGGSVGHQDAVDCAPEKGEGVIVVSEASPIAGGARFRYTRRFFVPQAPALYAEDLSLREKGSIRFNRFDTLHEFPNAPFGSCSVGA